MGLVVDKISGQVFLFDLTSGGTGGSGSTYSQVNLFSDLPAAATVPGEIYVVLTSSGLYVINRREAGLYYSNGATWRRLGDIPSFFNDDNFKIYDGTDNTREVRFQLSGVSTSTIRTVTIQNSNGTMAYLSDLNQKVDITAFADYTGTTAPATYLSKTDFNTYSASTLTLIGTKQNQLIAGNGINISGSTISVKLPSTIQLTDISGGTQVNTIPHTPITWTTQEYSGNSLNFTGGSRIYIQQTDRYEISYALNLVFVSGGRKNIGTVIKKNGITLISPLTSSSNMESNSTSGTNGMPKYNVTLSNGDYIELVAFRIGNAGSVLTVANGSWIRVNKII
ncbi:MAG: hypothetical protein HC836_41030 [Richelia sp. RM2_1_2]|nr:hypothetical protein [Richelia sp. RM2_1_2]